MKRKTIYDKKALELCQDFFEKLGLKNIASSLNRFIIAPTELSLKALCTEIEVQTKTLEGNKKARYISFLDGQYNILKGFIISYSREYSSDGYPMIVINKLEDETASFKDNPIKNLYLKYKDEECFERDYEKLTLILK